MTCKEMELQAEAINYYRKQIAELKDKLKNQKADYEIYYKSCYNAQKKAEKHLTKAKELLKKMSYEYQRLCLIKKETIAEAEQFLKEE